MKVAGVKSYRLGKEAIQGRMIYFIFFFINNYKQLTKGKRCEEATDYIGKQFTTGYSREIEGEEGDDFEKREDDG